MGLRISNKIGKLGEDIACKYLESRGFSVLERNYYKKWGEIDVVVSKNNKVCFVEVKTVSRENNIHDTDGDVYRAEDNIGRYKIDRLRRVIETYISERKMQDNPWSFCILTVVLSVKDKKARVSFIKDVTI